MIPKLKHSTDPVLRQYKLLGERASAAIEHGKFLSSIEVMELMKPYIEALILFILEQKEGTRASHKHYFRGDKYEYKVLLLEGELYVESKFGTGSGTMLISKIFSNQHKESCADFTKAILSFVGRCAVLNQMLLDEIAEDIYAELKKI